MKHSVWKKLLCPLFVLCGLSAQARLLTNAERELIHFASVADLYNRLVWDIAYGAREKIAPNDFLGYV